MHGHALGAGLLVALACDLRICSTDAVLGLLAARYGLFPALGTFRLPRLIGLGPARRLILSGETVDPPEAHRLGLVDHLVPAERFDDGVAELVARYAALSPAAVVAIKRLTGRAFDAPRDTVLAEALPLLAACLDAPDVAGRAPRGGPARTASGRPSPDDHGVAVVVRLQVDRDRSRVRARLVSGRRRPDECLVGGGSEVGGHRALFRSGQQKKTPRGCERSARRPKS